jgi:hypothetical protein
LGRIEEKLMKINFEMSKAVGSRGPHNAVVEFHLSYPGVADYSTPNIKDLLSELDDLGNQESFSGTVTVGIRIYQQLGDLLGSADLQIDMSKWKQTVVSSIQ